MFSITVQSNTSTLFHCCSCALPKPALAGHVKRVHLQLPEATPAGPQLPASGGHQPAVVLHDRRADGVAAAAPPAAAAPARAAARHAADRPQSGAAAGLAAPAAAAVLQLARVGARATGGALRAAAGSGPVGRLPSEDRGPGGGAGRVSAAAAAGGGPAERAARAVPAAGGAAAAGAPRSGGGHRRHRHQPEPTA